MEDLTGKTFGELTVLGISENKTSSGRTQWKCQCSCGGFRDVVGSKLKSGAAKTCGCSRKRKLYYQDYIGKTINNWFIESYAYKKNNKYYVNCICKCGTKKIIDLYNLTQNRSKDCGCGRKSTLTNIMKDNSISIGDKFGKLTVQEFVGFNKLHKAIYKCKCDCGNTITVVGASLKSEHTTSCGCINTKYNKIIKDYIISLNYNVLQEYYIDLSEYNNSYARFDIYVPDLRLVIEYDGEGHFKPIDWSGKGIEEAITLLEATQQRDKLKDMYCYDNNMFILRIPYTEQNNIKQLINETIKIITCND
jgi:hypothetical protein